MAELTEEAGCLSREGGERHSLTEGLSNTFSERKKNGKTEEFLNQNIRLLARCPQRLAVSPHLLLCQAPALSHPRTCCHPQPQSLSEDTLTAALAQPLPHLPSWAPQPIPSQNSTALICINHLVFSTQWFIPVSPPLTPFLTDCLHKFFSFFITSTPTVPYHSLLPSGTAHRWWVIQAEKGWWRGETDSPLAVLASVQALLMLSHQWGIHYRTAFLSPCNWSKANCFQGLAAWSSLSTGRVGIYSANTESEILA